MRSLDFFFSIWIVRFFLVYKAPLLKMVHVIHSIPTALTVPPVIFIFSQYICSQHTRLERQWILPHCSTNGSSVRQYQNHMLTARRSFSRSLTLAPIFSSIKIYFSNREQTAIVCKITPPSLFKWSSTATTRRSNIPSRRISIRIPFLSFNITSSLSIVHNRVYGLYT